MSTRQVFSTLCATAQAAGQYEEANALAPRIAKLFQQNPSPVCASIPR